MEKRKIVKNILLAFVIPMVLGLAIIPEKAAAQEDPYRKVSCRCGLMWGKGCKADNYGFFCAPESAEDCRPYASNCD